jgi:protein-disulfide isomerase
MARGERPGRIGVLVLLGIVCLSALIAGQVLGPERPREFATYGAGGDAVTAPTSRERPNSATVPASVPSAATSPATPPAHPLARFPIGPREVELDPRELPALGPVEAPYAIAVMSDYTCPHCRAFHPLLERVRQRYGNQIVIIILPVPLDGRCNPRILQTQPRHIHACELAHLALAVWCADPASFAEMDRWLMDGAVVPTVEEVRARARQLVGADNLARAEADPRVEQVLRRTVGLYDLAGGGQIPKLIPPKRVAPAQVRDANDLFVYLERELGISPK